MFYVVINNCFLDVYRWIIVRTPWGVDAIEEFVKRIHLQFTKPPRSYALVAARRRWFSGFVSSGLRHWYQGKGRRRRK
jgi:hypothetical protein